MKKALIRGGVLAVTASFGILVLGGCAQQEQWNGKINNSVVEKEDQDSFTTGSRLPARDKSQRADVKTQEGPIQSFGPQGLKGN